MPVVIDRTTEAALSTLFNDTFIRSLKQYLGMHPDTPSDDMPIDVEELLTLAVSTCETEQWRFILPKEVSILLPKEAFTECDGLVFLPFGSASSVELSYTDLDEDTQTYTAFTQYSGEPIKLYSDDWSPLYNDLLDSPYPVTITYTPGYTAYAQIPKHTIIALKILVYHYFEFRESNHTGVPMGYEHHRNHNLLNDQRAIKYVGENWNKVSAR